MVKSETRRDAEILVGNTSPRLFGKKVSRLKKSVNKPCKNEISRLVKNASEISRSCQNSPRPTFFEVPFATPIRETNTAIYNVGVRDEMISLDRWYSHANSIIVKYLGKKMPLVEEKVLIE